MRQFDFYEFAGVLAPGAVLLIGLALIFRTTAGSLVGSDFGAGDLGLFTILAYVAGQLIQAVGNAVELVWWKVWGGWPTEWPRSGKGHLLSAPQRDQLRIKIRDLLGMPSGSDPFDLPPRDWMAVTRQVDAAIQGADKRKRIETFNANYDLNRGVAATLLLLLALILVVNGADAWKAALLSGAAAVIALCRMHRFALHYGRELYVQFLWPPRASGGGS